MPVEVVIHVHNLELTDRLREYVEKKVSKLDRFLDVLEEAPEEDPEVQIVRRKRFLLVPMTEPEAIEQMELLGHPEFFVFFNAETNGVNVLYRRRDRTLGRIGTEVA